MASIQLPDGACCLGCGYLLHGLREPRCSECGRGFSPSDPATFGNISGSKRKRWLRRGIALAVVMLAYLGAGPRGMMHHSLTLSCGKCGEKISVERLELRPPSWISWHYPGWTFAPTHVLRTRSSTEATTNSSVAKRLCSRAWDSISFRDGATGGSGSVTCQDGYEPTYCGSKVTPETISTALRSVSPRPRAACTLKPNDEESAEGAPGGGS